MSDRKPYHHGRLAEALLADALELLRTKPPEELSLRELAERAGVSPRAPYSHFPTKEALLEAVAEEGFRKLVEESDATDGTVMALGEAYLGLAEREPHLFRLMFRHCSAGEGSWSSRSFDQVIAAAGRQCPDLSEEAREEAAVALWAFVHGLAVLRQEVFQGERQDLPLQRLSSLLIRTLSGS